MVETTSMRWVSALSTRPSLEAAINEVVDRTIADLSPPADLGLLFISSAFASEFSRVMPLLRERLPNVPIVGCSGGGIIGCREGQPREIEDEVALSLTLATLPGVVVHPFHLMPETFPDLDSSPTMWVDLIGVGPEQQPHFVLLSDPASPKLNDLLQGLDFAYPGSAKVGGIASSGRGSDVSALFLGDRLYRDGMVGVALSGNIHVETIVAQGCRPIGAPHIVTEAERNILLALEAMPDLKDDRCPVAGPRKPLEVLQEIVNDLDEDDRRLAQQALFVGVAQSEFKLSLEQGDFLIRVLLGVDPKMGAIAIGDRIRAGQRIQFHLRDSHASALDLDSLLTRSRQKSTAGAIGALMFSCLGRGQGHYGEPDVDSQLFSQYYEGVPLSGFFCNGEIGPVGGSTFLHGYTSVFGIFRPAHS